MEPSRTTSGAFSLLDALRQNLWGLEARLQVESCPDIISRKMLTKSWQACSAAERFRGGTGKKPTRFSDGLS